MNFELDKNLPECWEIVTIGEITLPYETEQPAKKPETEFKYIDIGSIDNSTQTITNIKTFLGKDAPSRARRIVRKDDILFSTVRTYLKNIARVPAELDGVLTSTGIAVLRCTSGIDRNFLFYSVLSDKFIRKISSTMDGTLYPAVTDTDVTSAAIVIPPLNEQRRIVAKIEALSARSQRVKEALEDIPQLLNQFRQSVLAAAFRGDLTADWREQNSNVEPASVLLERIQKKRQKQYQKACEEAKKKGHKKPRKIFLDEIPLVEDEFSDYLPELWRVTNIHFLAHVTKLAGFEYTKYIKLEDNGDIAVVRAQNVQMGMFVPENIKYISKDVSDFLERSQLHGREILMVFIGAGTGNVCLAPKDARWHLAPNVAKIDVDGIHTKYLLFYLQSPIGQKNTLFWAKATAQASLSMETIRKITVYLPPLEEQQEIVRRLESLLQVIDRIEQQYQQAKTDLDQLDQSILAKAFRGELVPQDPDDEPASVLLERIRAEREKLQTKAAKKSTPQTGGRRSKKASQQEEESVQLELGLE